MCSFCRPGTTFLSWDIWYLLYVTMFISVKARRPCPVRAFVFFVLQFDIHFFIFILFTTMSAHKDQPLLSILSEPTCLSSPRVACVQAAVPPRRLFQATFARPSLASSYIRDSDVALSHAVIFAPFCPFTIFLSVALYRVRIGRTLAVADLAFCLFLFPGNALNLLRLNY